MLGLVRRLRAFYGALPAPPSLPFAVYAWEVLSAGTMPARRDAAFGALRQIRALTPDAIARVPQAKLEAAVALAGSLRDERIRALRAGADVFRRTPSFEEDLAAASGGAAHAQCATGASRRALRAARRLPHLGRASTLRLLLFTGALPVLPLDEHAFRVARRLGYASAPRGEHAPPRTSRQPGDPSAARDEHTLRPTQRLGHPSAARDDMPLPRALSVVRQALTRETGHDVANLRAVTQYLTHHGLSTCTEASPHCGVCPIALDCEWVRRQ